MGDNYEVSMVCRNRTEKKKWKTSAENTSVDSGRRHDRVAVCVSTAESRDRMCGCGS